MKGGGKRWCWSCLKNGNEIKKVKKMKKVSNVLRDQWGHRAYFCNDCPEEKQYKLVQKRIGYEACQKLNLCAACYNKKMREV